MSTTVQSDSGFFNDEKKISKKTSSNTYSKDDTGGSGDDSGKSSDDIRSEDSGEDSDVDGFANFVKRFIEVDNEIVELKEGIYKQIRTSLRDKGIEKRKLALIIADIMKNKGIDAIEPKISGKVVGRITFVEHKRTRPTMQALNKTIQENIFNGKEEDYKKFIEDAIGNSEPATPTIRRTRPKTQ